eukprot:TRINITY_DN3325_c0_g1_i9.p3 TRINITY_DN3325_c0_g1~~TRINITY_DN3325_c0_g1_i9.p3  ORF type:complete len:151 (+),score=5.24 TRINITY_DN3325_c0_g1_i9:58-453(+)
MIESLEARFFFGRLLYLNLQKKVFFLDRPKRFLKKEKVLDIYIYVHLSYQYFNIQKNTQKQQCIQKKKQNESKNHQMFQFQIVQYFLKQQYFMKCNNPPKVSKKYKWIVWFQAMNETIRTYGSKKNFLLFF